MASPHVADAAAQLLSADPSRTSAEVLVRWKPSISILSVYEVVFVKLVFKLSFFYIDRGQKAQEESSGGFWVFC